MAAEDARYRQSSQFRLWSFSPKQLAAQRQQVHALARVSIAERIASASRAASSNNTPDPEGPSSQPASQGQSQNQNGNGSDKPVEFLSLEEEATLVNFHTSELIRAGDHIRASTEIRATAAVFFRRFYVTNSIMSYPPADMLLVALFFGSKAEGTFRNARKFAEDFNKSTEDILAGEFLLCHGIKFSFDVKHPYRALEGIMMQLRSYKDLDRNHVEYVYLRTREILKWSPLMTDAYFHYTPSQIVLASLSLCDRGLFERIIQETFRGAQPDKDGTDASSQAVSSQMRDKVMGTIEACREMLAREPLERKEYWTSTETSKSIIKPLNRKLRKCRDPTRANLVALQKARREQASRKHDADSDEERGEKKEKMDDSDPFGNPVAKRRKVGARDDGGDNIFGGALSP